MSKISQNTIKSTENLSTLWILSVISVFCLGYAIFYAHYNNSVEDFTAFFLYPLASNFLNGHFSRLIINQIFDFDSAMSLIVPISFVINLTYFIIKIITQRAFYSAIPFLISILVLVLPNYIVNSPIAVNYGSYFYEKASNIELDIPMLDYRWINSDDCNGLELSDNFPETETLHEYKLPNAISKLSSTGNIYYRKYKGQTEFYFPQQSYNNNYEVGYLYLSDNNSSNIKNLMEIYRLRCNWHETFGKKITNNSKP
ncbi:MAG TPA: hypothetical protein VLG12_03630 [Candidatus Saccharimonadales bacterium]|nr:hypothetical protein [Candidatus Saccharimonadales bacterium]